MKVLILGSTGMLGYGAAHALIGQPGIEVYRTYRDSKARALLSIGATDIAFNCLTDDINELLDHLNPDYVINCIGVIKPFIIQSIENAILINSVFPHKLANSCQSKNIKMIHITTDCVYSGRTGRYTEKDDHDEVDIYGKSKSLGEPKNCMVIRTSIIGEEMHKKVSLIEWVKGMKGKAVNGYLDHFWNGITTKQYGDVCLQIIKEGLYQLGLFHVHSPTAVNKFELLELLNKRFKLNLDITPINAPQKIDRTLSTTEDLQSKLQIPPLHKQLELI